MDYKLVPTTVFTPLEYGCIGLSEEDAIKEYGEENLKIYASTFKPLEWNFLGEHHDDSCYTKLICYEPEGERVVGFHYCGPNAGEVT